jgi:hypothetical protein
VGRPVAGPRFISTVQQRGSTVTSRKKMARRAGVLYALMGLAGAFGLVYFPSAFLVRGDAAATAARIAASPLLYRFAVVIELTAGALFICAALALYNLLKDVDRAQARAMVAFVIAQVAMGFALMLTQIAPLVLLSGGKYWSAFDRPQLEALALGSLTLRGQGIGAISAYWGLWLLPLGALVYKSRFLPRIIGVLLIVAGGAYVLSTLAFFFFPKSYRLFFMAVTTPAAALGELGLTGWLLIKGAREDPA